MESSDDASSCAPVSPVPLQPAFQLLTDEVLPSSPSPQKKCKNEPKEQRKPRATRQPANLPPEKKVDAHKAPEKPAEQEPGPEFYRNLKRETDDIIKITEEEKAKYNKKSIQSNWKKYEVPIESYEEREEQENLGADYQQLINAPISTGGHFQFKHEKSWDTTTKSTEYDKYFNMDMTKLGLALSTIPFYERNNIDINMFAQGDIKSMEYRAKKFKQKYCEENNELSGDVNIDPTDKLVATLKQSLKSPADIEKEEDLEKPVEADDIDFMRNPQVVDIAADISAEDKINEKLEENVIVNSENVFKETLDDELDMLLGKEEILVENKEDVSPVVYKDVGLKTVTTTEGHEVKNADIPKKTVLEPTKDLEQWLDDFLDS